MLFIAKVSSRPNFTLVFGQLPLNCPNSSMPDQFSNRRTISLSFSVLLIAEVHQTPKSPQFGVPNCAFHSESMISPLVVINSSLSNQYSTRSNSAVTIPLQFASIYINRTQSPPTTHFPSRNRLKTTQFEQQNNYCLSSELILKRFDTITTIIFYENARIRPNPHCFHRKNGPSPSTTAEIA